MNKKSIILIILAISLFALGIALALPYWYYGEWKDGIGWTPTTIIACAWALGMGVLLSGKVVKYQVPYKEIGILIITIYVCNAIVKAKKFESIKSNSGITYAKVLFKGNKYLHGFGIDYTYMINGVEYLKWDNDEDFIKNEKLIVGDSIEIVYNINDPHMHEFKDILNKLDTEHSLTSKKRK